MCYDRMIAYALISAGVPCKFGDDLLKLILTLDGKKLKKFLEMLVTLERMEMASQSDTKF